MTFKMILTIISILNYLSVFGQIQKGEHSTSKLNDNSLNSASTDKQFIATSEFIDAAIYSINSINGLIKKENYHIKITSFNNPTSSDIGFNLEQEIQIALKPILAKTKNTNTTKFSQVVSSIISTQSKSVIGKSFASITPVLPTVLSLVGALTLNEKKVNKEDLDSFILITSKYFIQYEKLNQVNNSFDQNISRLNGRLKDLQFDIKEFMLDIIIITNKNIQRIQIKNFNPEELYLKYLDKGFMQKNIDSSIDRYGQELIRYPSDGIKSAKEIAYNIQKIFAEYQKIYTENYLQVKTILLDCKSLGKNINLRQVESSLKELEELYNESKISDMLSLRLTTLFERLKILSATEQPEFIKK